VLRAALVSVLLFVGPAKSAGPLDIELFDDRRARSAR
jgi:hypothetical protein